MSALICKFDAWDFCRVCLNGYRTLFSVMAMHAHTEAHPIIYMQWNFENGFLADCAEFCSTGNFFFFINVGMLL